MKIIALITFLLLCSAAWEDCLSLKVSLDKLFFIFCGSLLLAHLRKLPLLRGTMLFLPIALGLYLLDKIYYLKRHNKLLGLGDLLLIIAISPQFSVSELLVLLKNLALCSLLTVACLLLLHSCYYTKKIPELFALRFPFLPLVIPALLMTRVYLYFTQALLY